MWIEDEDEGPIEPGEGYEFIDPDEDGIQVGDEILLPSEPMSDEDIEDIRNDNDDPTWEPKETHEWVTLTDDNWNDTLPAYGQLPPIRREILDDAEQKAEDEDDRDSDLPTW